MAQRLPRAIAVRVSLRAAIAVATVLLVVLPGTAGPRDPVSEHDLRTFYESVGHRTVWVNTRGRPTPDAHRVLARLHGVLEDGLEPGDYNLEQLGLQAAALDGADAFSAPDAAAFDVAMTLSVLTYFRHLHLGRANPRTLGFHLDHALEPHDFPGRLRSALSAHGFDRVVSELRPAFVQYRALRESLGGYRGRDAARARQIELAMERLRWLPELSGERLLVVNIPMFYLWGWDVERADGIPSIGMATITGRAGAMKTPVFTSAITSVVLNPDWIVPESILRNEILPAIAANPHYLSQHHMEMSGSADAPRVRQLPGPWNALGPVKFLLPNVHGVYLHGTPAQALFKKERRDFSHGCVRVEDPFALAAWMLKDEPDWPLDRIRATAADGVTRTIKVARPPRIVLFYITAAFDPADGRVQFADDVYGHDARLDAWLRARASAGEQ